MRFIDWFSGIGGFTLGLSRAGMAPVGACEIDPYARAVYRKRFPHVERFPEDITQVQPESIPDADLWCGGFPAVKTKEGPSPQPQ